MSHALSRVSNGADDRKKFFFDPGTKPQRNVRFIHIDGRNTRVAVTGEKSFGSGERAQPFRYQLCRRSESE